MQGRRPPEERGRRLFTGERPGRDGRPDAQLRIHASEFNGHPFVAITVWERGQGGFWPVKAVSVRRRELAGVIAALRRAERELAGADGVPSGGLATPARAAGRPTGCPADGPPDRPKPRSPHPPWLDEDLPPTGCGGAEDFDEFMHPGPEAPR